MGVESTPETLCTSNTSETNDWVEHCISIVRQVFTKYASFFLSQLHTHLSLLLSVVCHRSASRCLNENLTLTSLASEWIL
jgi:hypothetical protein